MLRNLVLMLASLSVALAGLEVAARLELLPLPEFVLTSDASWQERWFRKRRGLNPREFVELDADLGYIPAANLDDLEYEGVRISTNSAHMRGRREYPVERTDATRIAVVGDSYVFGECANDLDAFPAVMEELLPNTEVLNLGVMGYGQDQALLRLRRDGFRHAPDIAVFGFYATDMRRNLLSFRGYGKPRFRLTEAGLELENVPVPTPEEYERWWPPRLWNFVRIFLDSRVSGTPEQNEYKHRLSTAIVQQMAVESEAHGARLLVVHLPKTGDVKREKPWSFMTNLCEGEKPVEYLCASPVERFRKIVTTEEEFSHHFDCHYSTELYRAVAEEIAAVLLQEYPELFRVADATGSARALEGEARHDAHAPEAVAEAVAEP